jgi:hypothetical protein
VVDILYNGGSASFGTLAQVQTYGEAVAIAAPDLIGDGRPDLLAVNNDINNVAAYLSGQEGTTALSNVTFADALVHVADAVYSGDTVFAGWTTNTVTMVATNYVGTTSTVLAVSPGTPSMYGQTLTLTATMAPVTANGQTATGSITFFDGTTSLGTVAINASGVAVATVNAPAVAVHTYTAAYSGSTYFSSSTSVPVVYTVAQNSTSLTIPGYTGTTGTSGSATVTVVPGSTGTGQGLPTGTLTYQFPGFNTQTATVTSGSATITVPAGLSGTGNIVVAYSGDGSYTSSTGVLGYTITGSLPALIVTVNNASRTYGEANPQFSSVTTGALNGDTFTVTYATTATLTSPVGTYPITATVTGANIGAYSLTVIPATLTVTQAPLTIAANNASRQVGASNPTFTGTVTGALNGDSFTESFTTTATTASPAGSYPIVPSVTGTNLADYSVTVVDGTLTVGSLYPLTVTVANATRQYGAANPTFTGTVTGAQNGDTFTPTYSTTATATSAVGTYPITASVTGTDISAYSVTVNAGTLTVSQAGSAATLTVSSASVAYGATLVITVTVTPSTSGTPTGTVTFYDGATKLGTATLLGGVGTLSINSLALGAHTLSASYSGDGNFTASSSNSIAETVNKGSLTVTVANATRVYGAADPTFTSTIAGAASGDTFTVTYSTSDTAASPVGSYPISATVTGTNLANYNLSVVPGTLTITPAPLTVTANSVSRVYDSANPTFTGTVSGALNGDSFTLTYTTTATTTSDVGTYAIVPSATGTNIANYTVTAVKGTLTITPLTGITLTAGNATRTYGTANPTFTATMSGTLTGITLTLGGTTTATITSDAGTFAIVPTFSGVNAADILPTLVNGTLTIVPANTATTMTTSVSSSSQGTNVVLTATVTSSVSGTPTGTVAFYAANTYLGAAPLAGGVATLTTNAIPLGTSTLTAHYGGGTDFNASVSAGTTYTVTLPVLTATASNATKAYGAANPVFSGTLTGALNGDTFTLSFSTTATMTSVPGTYPIVPNVSGANLGNYSLVSVPGTLTISPLTATLLLNASSSSTAYGSALVLTAVLAGSGITPTGAVSFYDGATLLGTATPVSGVVSFTTTTLTVGTHSLTAKSAADTYYAATTSNAVAETITAGSGGGGSGTGSYTITASPNSLSVVQTATGTSTISITPVAGFTGQVTLSCGGLPQYATCTFSPATVTLNGTVASTSTLTIGTGLRIAEMRAPQSKQSGGGMSLAGLLLLPAGLLAGIVAMRRKKLGGVRLVAMLLAAALGLAMLAGCAQVTINGTGTSSSQVTPTGTTTFTVTALTVGSTAYQSVPITITVTQ